jgi:hypothetical protein
MQLEILHKNLIVGLPWGQFQGEIKFDILLIILLIFISFNVSPIIIDILHAFVAIYFNTLSDKNNFFIISFLSILSSFIL